MRCWWECKLVQLLWEQYGGSSKNLKQICHLIRQSHFWVRPQKK